ncbi:MAG: metal ABC transporter ATP-binding protein [Clostridia bacterium]|nr:metal ABC transporter ATP-binding protein [Clostridia bacterium]
MKLIDCQNVYMNYDSTKAVNGVSFSVDSGDFLCIVGENGTGKSTLLKGILGLQKVNSGTITFTGIVNKEIGYLPQKTAVQKDFPASVREVVLSGCQSRGFRLFYTSADRKKAQKNIELLGIDGIKNKPFNELSGGQQQRVLLARALCATDKLLLLDEPTTGLDPFVTAELYRIVDELNKKHGVAVVMVTHDLKNSVQYANKILCMEHDGDFFGTVDEYMKTPAARMIFGGGTNA